MPDSRRFIIADTSCLIILTKIEALDILKVLVKNVTITPTIQREFGTPLPDWIEVFSPDEDTFRAISKILDEGEASAIALCLKNKESTIILDDIRARKYAHSLGMNVIGTLGILVKAQKTGVIESAIPYIEKIQETNFRLSEKVLKVILEELK